MTAVTVSTALQSTPNAGVKRVVLRTDANCATGFTLAAGDYGFSDLYATYLCDDAGAVKIATWSALVVTIGTVSTGVHTLILEGI